MPPIRGIGFGKGSFELDLIYAIAIIVACILIYYRTKELYDLTGYKGIKFFRKTFLFFGIAFLVRFFARFFMLGFDLHRVLLPKFIIFPLVMLFFFYATTMAVFYLVQSVAHKKLKNKAFKEKWLHLTAVLIALVSFVIGAPFIPLLIQTALLLYAAIEIYTTKKKHASDFRGIYLLLFIFSLLNIVDIAVPNFFRTAQLIIYALSIAVFYLIVYKVYEKTNTKK